MTRLCSDSIGELLRISTVGSVDDGKSTLIGRLLYDTQQIMEDQFSALERASKTQGADYLNLALLTDGLRAEREQGITIDVAYRYFATPCRRFIMADTPGHVQYTRNMATGASTADAAMILIDARRGVSEQSRRHALISSLLGVPHLIVCINKMDLVDYAGSVYEQIKKDFAAFSSGLHFKDIVFVPVSALHGDNVVTPSANMPWYKGTPLLSLLENLYIAADRNLTDIRFPVQSVIRPISKEYHDYRGYAGQLASGVLRPGDNVIHLPSGVTTRIKSIDTFEGPMDIAFPPMCVILRLEDHLDISRGNMICGTNDKPAVSQDLEAMLCWFDETPLQPGTKYAIKHTTQSARVLVKEVRYRLDVNTLSQNTGASALNLNEIGRVSIRATSPLFYDPYVRNRGTGCFILIDEATNRTSAAGMIL